MMKLLIYLLLLVLLLLLDDISVDADVAAFPPVPPVRPEKTVEGCDIDNEM